MSSTTKKQLFSVAQENTLIASDISFTHENLIIKSIHVAYAGFDIAAVPNTEVTDCILLT